MQMAKARKLWYNPKNLIFSDKNSIFEQKFSLFGVQNTADIIDGGA
jgi:hypothetical protein